MLEKDKRRRELLVGTEGLKQKRNEVSAEIANAKRNKQDATDAIKEMREVGAKIKSLDEELEEVEATVKDMASRLPNLPNPTIPVGPDESANVELRKVGTPRELILNQRRTGISVKISEFLILTAEQRFQAHASFTIKDWVPVWNAPFTTSCLMSTQKKAIRKCFRLIS